MSKLLPLLEALGPSLMSGVAFQERGAYCEVISINTAGHWQKQTWGKIRKRSLKSWADNGHVARKHPQICVSSNGGKYSH